MIDVAQTPLVLRKFEDDDAEDLLSFRNDPELKRQLVGFSIGYSEADMRSWIEYHRGRTDEVVYAIVDEASNRCIGHVGMYQIDHRIGKARFGILIGDKKSQGKGWGRAVTARMLDFAFDELNLHKVALAVLAENERAVHLYESLGFVHEGVMRDDQFRDGRYLDVALMSIIKSEWNQSREQPRGQS